MTLYAAYLQGQTTALRKFALEAPTAVDQLMAAVDQAPDAPPPATAPVPGPIPTPPPALAADPLPQTMQDPMQMPANIGKEAALGLQQILFLERAMGKDDAHSMLADVERQMQGQGGGRTGTLHIGAGGTKFQERPKLPTKPVRPSVPSIGTQAAKSVITSAKRPLPGV